MIANFVRKIVNSNKFKAIILNNIFYCFKLCGIATIRIHSTWVHETKKWKWSLIPSRSSVFYNICLTCSLITMHILTYENTLKSGFGGRFDKDKVVIAIFDSLIIMTTVIIIMIYCFKQKKILVIANKMSEAEEFVDLSTSVLKHYLSWFCFGNILIWFLFVILSLKKETFQLVYTIAFTFSIYTINSLLIQYSMLIKLIQNFFENINENLIKLYNKSTEFNRARSVYTSNLNNKLENLMHSYCAINDLSHEISDFYSQPVLWSLLAIFIDILMCLYHLIKQLIITNNILAAFNLHDVIQVFFHFTILATLTICVTDTIEEVKSKSCVINYSSDYDL